MIRILHVIPGLEIGGAETMLVQLVRTLGAPNYAHTVVNMQSHGPLTQPLESAGARVVHLGMRRGRPSAAGLGRLTHAAQTVRYQIMQGWMYHGNLGAQLAAAVASHKPAVIWSVHTHQPPPKHGLASWAVARANAALSRRPDAVVYVARAALQAHTCAGFGQDNAVYIPGGIDTRIFSPKPEARAQLRSVLGVSGDAPIVAIIARLHPMKDHPNFLAAASYASAKTHFVLVGEGLSSPPEALQPFISSELQSRLHWLGARQDITSIIQGADVCTLSSSSEALPRVLLEAMACETPCAATDVGDCAALLRDVGWLAAPHDPPGLARAWTQALDCSNDIRAARLRRGRARIEAEYSLGHMGRAFGALYTQFAV